MQLTPPPKCTFSLNRNLDTEPSIQKISTLILLKLILNFTFLFFFVKQILDFSWLLHCFSWKLDKNSRIPGLFHGLKFYFDIPDIFLVV